MGDYRKTKHLAETFDVSERTAYRIVKLIKEHPERYGTHASLGEVHAVGAFADALKWHKEIAMGVKLPAFDDFQSSRHIHSFVEKGEIHYGE